MPVKCHVANHPSYSHLIASIQPPKRNRITGLFSVMDFIAKFRSQTYCSKGFIVYVIVLESVLRECCLQNQAKSKTLKNIYKCRT